MVVPTADANHPIVSVKDPTVVYDGGRWHVFTTTADQNGAWSMAYFNFTSWDQAPQARPFYLEDNPNLRGYNAAPQVFYYRPQNKWYLIFQSGTPRYSTTTNIADPMSWSAPQDFFPSTPSGVVNGWLDFWIICDATHAYLFAPDDLGRFYRSRTTLANFPNGFSNPVIAMQAADNRDLFEGSCVYKLNGSNQSLGLFECISKSSGGGVTIVRSRPASSTARGCRWPAPITSSLRLPGTPTSLWPTEARSGARASAMASSCATVPMRR